MDERLPDPAEESRPETMAEGRAGADDTPLGGDDTTEEQLDADNEIEKDALKSLDPDDSPA